MTNGPISRGQIAKLSKLLDKAGVGAYRNAKKALGIPISKTAQNLTSIEAKALLNMLRKR